MLRNRDFRPVYTEKKHLKFARINCFLLLRLKYSTGC